MKLTGSRRFILWVVILIVTCFISSWLIDLYAQVKSETGKQENFHRPVPKDSIRPTIPEVNRFQDDKVFLEQADSLFRPANSFEEYQVVKGNVKFRQGGMWMFCDSAYYYPERNSMDAFGHVEMQQGDTLFVYADKLIYNGEAKHATLIKGPSRGNVELRNRNVSLTTDSLDYDVVSELGWYTTGGKLRDDVNTLTSVYGEFSASQNEAKFRYDVVLVNNKDGYKLYTEELDYNTDTHIATINTSTRIESANDTIITTQGFYNTRTDHAELTSRSTILHSDSSNNVVRLEGDSIIYDKQLRISKAYMFRDGLKNRQPMVITDTARKVQLIGGYGEYNDSTSHALATQYPLLIEFSRPDSLFLRADTILSYIRQEYVWPDSLSHGWSAATRARLATYKSMADMSADSPEVSLELLPYGFPTPGYGIVKTANLPGKTSKPDSLVLETYDERETVRDKGSLDQRISEKEDSEEVEEDGIILRVDALGRDSTDMILKDFHVAKAIGHARMFSNDMQGVADTMIFRQFDSLLHLIRKPVVWNENRQVIGGKIIVHFNDSTPDYAILPESGFMTEHVDEDFYNQMSGNVMKAWLEDKKLKKLDVDGNVEIIYLPEENDSSYNKLVNAESSYLTIDFKDGQIDHLRMWPEVSGTVYPIVDVRQSQKYLKNFIWLEQLRPVRAWYGDRYHWIDELGELPEVVEKWFKEPELIKGAPTTPSLEMREQVR